MSTYTEDNNSIYTCQVRASVPQKSKDYPVPPDAVLISYSGGPGVVEAIQFSSTQQIYNENMRIYVDNNSYIELDIPTFFGFALNPAAAAYYNPLAGKQDGINTNIFGGVNNENYICNCDLQYGWGAARRVFIPFQGSIYIEIRGTAIDSEIMSCITYRKWPSAYPLYYSIGARRKFWVAYAYGTWQNPIVMTPFSTTTTPVTNGVGQIESIVQVLYAVSKINEQTRFVTRCLA